MIAQSRVDHWMRFATGEIIVAHIDQRVIFALPDICQSTITRNWRIGSCAESLLLADKLRFVAEGSSGENTAYRLAMGWQALAGVL